MERSLRTPLLHLRLNRKPNNFLNLYQYMVEGAEKDDGCKDEWSMQMWDTLSVVIYLRRTAWQSVRSRASGMHSNIVVDTLLVSTAAGLIVVLPFVLIDNFSFALDISNWPGMSLLFSATPEPSVD